MPPYPPSLIDRFMNWIQRLPVPYWLTYFLLFILESMINHVIAWVDGWLPPFTFTQVILLFPLWQWGTFAALTYLNTTSEAALARFRPLLDCDEAAIDKKAYEMTTMPRRGVILSGLLWLIVYSMLTWLAYDAFYVGYGLGISSQVFIFLEGLVCFATGSVIYYHSLRQLWLVNRLVQMVKRFNLFSLQPVHAFSRLTARTGITWMFLLALTLLTFPLDMARWLMLVMWAFQVGLALAAFILPLRFVNYHLIAEKRRLLADNSRRIESALGQLHQRLDQNEFSEMELLHNAIEGLTAERDILAKIPTWPWKTSTLTGFLSAIVLPVVLLLIQIMVQKWLGG